MSDLTDINALRKVGIIQQKQKEHYALRLRAVAGDLTAEQLIAVARVAGKYGNGNIHLTTRQGIEIHYVRAENVASARQELEEADIQMGACGPRVRVVVGCPGAETCKWGVIDTKEVARKLDADYFRQDTPYKFKFGVTGCPHNCAKANENDIGVMGGLLPKWVAEKCIQCDLCLSVCPTGAIHKNEDDNTYSFDDKCFYCSICTSSCPTDAWEVDRSGYLLFVGGTMGKFPRLGNLFGGLMTNADELYELVDRCLKYYQRKGRKKERFGHLIDQIGYAQFKKDILDGSN